MGSGKQSIICPHYAEWSGLPSSAKVGLWFGLHIATTATTKLVHWDKYEVNFHSPHKQKPVCEKQAGILSWSCGVEDKKNSATKNWEHLMSEHACNTIHVWTYFLQAKNQRWRYHGSMKLIFLCAERKKRYLRCSLNGMSHFLCQNRFELSQFYPNLSKSYFADS